MKKFGSIILVLALVLALFPVTALADDAFSGVTVYVTGTDSSSQSVSVAYSLVAGDTSIGTIVTNATAAVTALSQPLNGGIVKAIVFNGGSITVNDSYTVPGGADAPKIVFNNTAVTVNGTLNMANKALILGSSTITVNPGATVQYGGSKKIGPAAGNNIKVDSGALTLKFSKDGGALSLSGADVATIAGYFTSYDISLDMTFAGAFTITDRFALNYYDVATITNGSTVTLADTFAATDQSKIINNGTITGSGYLRTGDAKSYPGTVPTIENNGTISVSNLLIKAGGGFSNAGNVTSPAIELEHATTFNNSGTITTTNIKTFVQTDPSTRPLASSLPANALPANVTNTGSIYVTTLDNANGAIYDYGNFQATNVTGTPIVKMTYGGYYGGFQGTTGPSMTASTSSYAGGNLYFSTSGMFGQFKGLTAGGITLNNGTDYTVENRGGYAYITVYESALTGLSGNVRFTATFSDGSASAYVTMGYYVPDEIVLDPPKTGDAANLMGLGFIFIACALAVVTRKVRARAK